MCLALPVKVVEVGPGDAAVVDLGGVRKEISLALLDGVQVGDYVEEPLEAVDFGRIGAQAAKQVAKTSQKFRRTTF